MKYRIPTIEEKSWVLCSPPDLGEPFLQTTP